MHCLPSMFKQPLFLIFMKFCPIGIEIPQLLKHRQFCCKFSPNHNDENYIHWRRFC